MEHQMHLPARVLALPTHPALDQTHFHFKTGSMTEPDHVTSWTFGMLRLSLAIVGDSRRCDSLE